MTRAPRKTLHPPDADARQRCKQSSNQRHDVRACQKQVTVRKVAAAAARRAAQVQIERTLKGFRGWRGSRPPCRVSFSRLRRSAAAASTAACSSGRNHAAIRRVCISQVGEEALDIDSSSARRVRSHRSLPLPLIALERANRILGIPGDCAVVRTAEACALA